jgi:hypothetical protein
MVEATPPVIDELIKYAAQLARPFLTTPSLSSYPNSCELCIYYTAFDSKIGRHRDNFVSKDLTTYLSTRDATVLYEQRHSQLANSNVLIMSLGNAPMVLQLTFPRASTHDSVGTRSTYVVHPLFSVPCSFGTLFVFSPIDDLFYCHEAFFELSTLSRFGATGYRLAFVMRWLSPTTAPEHVFYAEGVPPLHIISNPPSIIREVLIEFIIVAVVEVVVRGHRARARARAPSIAAVVTAMRIGHGGGAAADFFARASCGHTGD